MDQSMINSRKEERLETKAQYAGWRLKLKIKGIQLGFTDSTGKITTGKETELFYLIIESLSLNVLSKIPQDNESDPKRLLKDIERIFGFKTPILARNEWKKLRMNSLDPEKFLITLDKLENEVKIVGGKITIDDKIDMLLGEDASSGLHQGFYSRFITDQRIKYDGVEITNEIIEMIRNELTRFYRLSTKEEKNKYERKDKETALVTKANEKKFEKKEYEERQCDHCQKRLPNVPKVFKSHNTKDCKNKPDEAYFDTCATSHITNKTPSNITETYSSIVTGNGSKTPITGTGTFKVGNIKLNNTKCAPGMKYNLVSAQKLVKTGIKATIQQSTPNLQLEKDGKVVGTGNFDDSGLLKMDNHIEPYDEFEQPKKTVKAKQENVENDVTTENQYSFLTLTDHCKFGHLGKSDEECIQCLQSKQRKRNIPRKSPDEKEQSNNETEVLEKIHVDLQGPFPIEGSDGTRWNIKAVDSKSKYVKMETINSKASKWTKEFIERFKNRSERQTGKTIKMILTDSGNEFNGEFVNYLETQGIIKRKGHGYDHHYPPLAENAHKTITGMARAMLSYSKLPEKYYVNAMLTACYVLNRWSEDGKLSRYEKFFNKKPRTNHIYPFGAIGYAFIPPELRQKQQDTRVKCRLLGYLDDDDTEEMEGYWILIEETGQISVSNDVKFSNEPITELPNSALAAYDPEWFDLFDNVDITTTDQDEYEPELSNTQLSGTTSYQLSSNTRSNDTNTSNQTPQQQNDEDDFEPEDSEDEIQLDNMRQIRTRSWYRNMPINQTSAEIEDERQLDFIFNENMIQTHVDDINQNTEENPNQNALLTATTSKQWGVRNDEIALITLEEDENDDFVFITEEQDNSIPKSQSEAYRSTEAEHWKKAEEEEMEALRLMQVINQTFDKLPDSTEKAIDTRWVYAKKYDKDGNFIKYKARLVAKGYMEKVDRYTDFYSPTADIATTRILCWLAINNGWKLKQDDQKNAFLNSTLDIGKYIKLPNGKFAYILKALYGLKIAPKQWHNTYKNFMKEQGFKQCTSEPCLYYKNNLFAVVHVDDTLTTGEEKLVEEFRAKLRQKFKSGEGGDANWYLGARITQNAQSIVLDQEQYTKDILNKFSKYLGSNEKKKTSTPLDTNFQKYLIQAEKSNEYEKDFPYREMVGSLVYLSIFTRIDISAAVSIVSKYLANPKKIHCDMVRRIYWYLRFKPSKGIVFKKGNQQLKCYCDSSFGNLENYGSLGGYIVTIGDIPILWKALRMKTTLSTSEAEYVALTPAIKDTIWLKGILDEIGIKQKDVEIFEDNQGCIALVNNPQSSRKTRHIQVRYHWIRDQFQSKKMKLTKIDTKDQLADLMTKGLYGPNITSICNKLSVNDLTEVSQQEEN
jgi:hypothetical protein